MTRPEPLPPEDISPVLIRAITNRPRVSTPDKPFAFYGGVIGIAVVGVFVFSSLSRDRTARADTGAKPPPAQTAPIPPQGAPFPAAQASLSPQSPPTPSFVPQSSDPSSADAATRMKAPAMVVDIGAADQPAASGSGLLAGTSASGGAKPAGGSDAKLSAEERFAERVSGSSTETVSATRLSNVSLIAPQGTVIPAILETAINSDLPGFVRAVVSRDVRGFDGSTVLVPRGSKLIGQYRSGVAVGQSRAFVVWSRLLTPDGISVDIGSPGADRLGRGGLDGETNTHFFKRFGASILLSVLSAGLDAASSHSNNGSNTAIVIGSPQQATNVASIALQKQIDIPDTINVPQGAPIRVFIARDLDFSSVMKKAQ